MKITAVILFHDDKIEDLYKTINSLKNEVDDIHFLEIKDLNGFLKNNPVTPWFKLIANTKLEEYSKINRNELKHDKCLDNKIIILVIV